MNPSESESESESESQSERENERGTVPERVYRKPDPAARRQRMRDFQSQLAARMTDAMTGARVQASQLGIKIGADHWLLNLQEAGEIVSVGAITEVPLTQPWFLGITSLRGKLISVVDLGQFLGQAPIPSTRDARIIAFGPALAFNGALRVARVMGLRNVADMRLHEAPADAHASVPAWLRQRYVDPDGVIWHQLDLATLIQDVQFLHVGA
ncbi:chemotaxis protein CheW [Actimicrobium antarcticum]|uniref:CheW-like domain-containing protein n=1 Tax=Actimicrobium antarcticum TaxID=1051899 RepID=A0ABP7TBI9_9BURK